jgi:hypothetical protein
MAHAHNISKDAPLAHPQPPALARELLGAGVVLTLVAYALSARSVLDQDVFIMAEIAQRVLQGARLYATVWDNKPPLTLLIYAVPQLFAFGSYTALQVFLGVLTCAQGWLWMRYAPGPWLLRCGGAVVVALFPLSNYYFAWFSSEDTANLFVFMFLLCAYRAFDAKHVTRGDALGMGITLVLAFHARQTTVVFGPLALIALWGARAPLHSKWQSLAWMVAGALGALAAVIGLMLWVGDLAGYINAVFFGPQKYAGNWRLLIDLISAFRSDITTFLFFAALAYLLTQPALRWFALMAAVATIACILLPKRDHLHYWEQIGPCMVLLVHMAARSLAERDVRWERAAGIVVPCFFVLNVSWTLAKCVISHDTAPAYAAAHAIDASAKPGDRLLVIGPSAGPIYYASRLPHAHMYFWEFYLYGIPDVLPEPLAQIISEYRQHPPELMAVDKTLLARIQGAESPNDNVSLKLVRSLLSERTYREVDLAAAPPMNLEVFRLAR